MLHDAAKGMNLSSGPRVSRRGLRIPTIANGRADLALVVLSFCVAVIAALIVAVSPDPATRTSAGIGGVVLVALPLVLVKRVELVLYPFFVLLTFVRVEPAPVDLMTVGLLGALALRGEGRVFKLPTVVLIATVALLVAYALALAVAQFPDVAATYSGATLLVVAMGYVTYQLAARDPRLAERAYVLAAMVLAIEAIVALSSLPNASVLRQDGFRVQAFFKDPNVLGPFAVPAVLLLCVRWPMVPIPLRLIALTAALLPIAGSLSRGALLVLVAALLALAGVAAYRRLYRVLFRCLGILALAAGIVVLVVFLPGSSLAERKMTSLIQPYDAERFAGQLAGLEHVRQDFASLGIGPGNYELVLGHPSHETYLRLLVETGPISVIALLVLVWSAVRLVSAHDLGAVAWACALVGFALCGLFIDTLHWRHLWVVLGLALAAAAYRGQVRTPTGRVQPERSSAQRPD